MSNSEYLKRYAAPKSWIIERKTRTFISKPNPGSHPLSRALPLGFVLETLGFAATSREVKKLLLAKEVMVDGRRVKDHRFAVGLFDTIELPDLKQAYRAQIDAKGRLVVVPAALKDLHHKPCRVVGKTAVKGNKIQINLNDSRNVLAKEAVAVGDTLVLDVPSQKVVKHLKLAPGANILITAGRYVGSNARVANLDGDTVRFTINDVASETQKENTYVIP
ncbi:30S ribosomal protein S4e [Candidatus Woesearchaeota archaeon]|nr:30S ribosomal protein S4e [Candidatus Woesearchaeota archaeon]